MTTVVLAELPTSAADRFRLLVADSLDAARERLHSAHGLFRLRGFMSCHDRAEAHRLAALIRSFATTTSTGALAFTERALGTVLSALKIPTANPVAEDNTTTAPITRTGLSFDPETIHKDGPLLWVQAQLEACNYIRNATTFNPALRDELAFNTSREIGRCLRAMPGYQGPSNPVGRAAIAYLSKVSPEAARKMFRDAQGNIPATLPDIELQHEPFQLAPEPVAAPAPTPVAKQPAPPAPTKAPAKGNGFGKYLAAVCIASFAGCACMVPGLLAGSIGSLAAKPFACGFQANGPCERNVENVWIGGGVLLAAFAGFTGALYSAGAAAAVQSRKS